MKNETISLWRIPSPVGEIRLYANSEKLIGLFMEKEKRGPIHRTLKAAIEQPTPLLRETEKQLRSYFAGRLDEFTIPLELRGTEFQRAVWRQLSKISHGSVVTYGDVARSLRRPKAVRAVSAAIGSNPVSILIPCHRVVGHSGALTGYAGGLEAKEWLLRHEGSEVRQKSIVATPVKSV